MSKKNFPHISVTTLPNGYALTVGKHEYLALSPESLVDLVFVHIAIGELDYINRDMAAGLLQAAATWKDVGEALSANAQLLGETRRAEREYQSALRGQAKANEECEAMRKERDRFYEKNLELQYELQKAKDKIDGIGRTLVGGSRPVAVIKEPKKYPSSTITKEDVYGKPKKKKGKDRYARKDD